MRSLIMIVFRQMMLWFVVLIASTTIAFAQSNQNTVPDDDKLIMLIRTTIIGLNHANRTGNYTVFRDLAAPSFRLANASAKLAEIFSKIRGRNLDLGPVVIFTPKLLEKAKIDDRDFLHLRGFFATRPEQVNFNLVFQNIKGNWLLFGISLNTSKAPNIQVSKNKTSAKKTPSKNTAPPLPARKPQPPRTNQKKSILTNPN